MNPCNISKYFIPVSSETYAGAIADKQAEKAGNRIDELFKNKRNNILSVYFTAGHPHLNDTLSIIEALEKSGADMIEIGMPYSDPLADGPVIQASSTVALKNGMTIEKLFEQLKNVRASASNQNKTINIPLVLMGYMNPVLQYGFEKFCAKAVEAGIDGLILPDLPMYEYESEYKNIIGGYGLKFIFLVTPETSDARIKQLDALSSGFLYAVSSSSTTGKDKDFNAVEKYLQRLKNLQLNNPMLVGFGIKDKQTFQSACMFANGAIIGTAYIKALENSSDIQAATAEFIKSVLA